MGARNRSASSASGGLGALGRFRAQSVATDGALGLALAARRGKVDSRRMSMTCRRSLGWHTGRALAARGIIGHRCLRCDEPSVVHRCEADLSFLLTCDAARRSRNIGRRARRRGGGRIGRCRIKAGHGFSSSRRGWLLQPSHWQFDSSRRQHPSRRPLISVVVQNQCLTSLCPRRSGARCRDERP